MAVEGYIGPSVQKSENRLFFSIPVPPRGPFSTLAKPALQKTVFFGGPEK
jgi:hypothetical protein